ncbi:hypothetical protein ACLOJK_040875, partial [Asimina triloba]
KPVLPNLIYRPNNDKLIAQALTCDETFKGSQPHQTLTNLKRIVYEMFDNLKRPYENSLNPYFNGQWNGFSSEETGENLVELVCYGE